MQAIIFIGLQASGKSSFYAQRFYRTHVRINLDMLKTRHRERRFLETCLETQQRFVIDNTNPTPEDRQRYIEPARNAKFEVIGYYFESKLTDCLRRNQNRTGKERIPDKGLCATQKRLVIPRYAEGFAKLYNVQLAPKNYFIVRERQDEV